MSQKNLSLPELLDLIELEAYRGIIDKNEFLKTIMEKGIPRVVNDVRGAIRLELEREGAGFSVTQYQTAAADESRRNIYPIGNGKAANDNGMHEISDQAA